jgi:ABC-2 type transport system permease protein
MRDVSSAAALPAARSDEVQGRERTPPNLVARHRHLAARTGDASATYTPAGGRRVPPPASPALWAVLRPKWLTARARAAAGERGRAARWAVLAVVGFGFWLVAFGALYRVLRYFAGVEEIGALLAARLLGLLLLSFAAILLLSNIITSLSSFFLARDLDLLVSSPVDWLTLYSAKLLETAVHSSWMVVLLSLPMLAAYGLAYDGGLQFALVAVAGFLPFLLIPAAFGSAVTLILVNVFPARRTRDILSVIGVLAAAGVVVLFRLIRPEQLARPEGFRSLVEFITVLRGPTSPILPSEWLQRTLMGSLTGSFDPLPLYLLWTTAGAFVVLGALLHRALYPVGFTRAQEGAERRARAGMLARLLRLALHPLGTLRRELVLKELRLFFRDSTQWSQLILLAVLVVVYVVNIRFLPLTGDGMTFFIVNVIPFLNLALAGFVLASIAARFLFPAVSLEGRTWWLLRASAMSMRHLLWAKFWTGTMPLLVLAVAIIVVTDWMLQVSPFMFVVSTLTITLLTFAIAGLAVGFGTLYPRFETENAAQIPTSFGGLLFMMTAVSLIGVVIVLEARPVYAYLNTRAFGGDAGVIELSLGFGAAAAVCLAATFIPLRVAQRRLEAIER